jgi:carboxyl-terminal processing protease
MSRLTKLLVISLSVLVFCYVAIGFVLGQATQNRPYRSLTVFSEVLQHIQQDYVEEPNMPMVTAGALHGLLEALDPQSSYLSPQEYAEYKRRTDAPPKGEIGVTLSKRFGYVAVVSILPESPASRAGIRSGDILENIAGFSTREMSIGQARMLLAGEPQTGVRVSVLRTGRSEPQELDVVRANPVAPRIVVEKLEPGGVDGAVAYLKVPAFPQGKAEELRARLTQLDKQGLRRLVLDLRDSASGDVNEAVEAAKLFLEKGLITTLRGQTVARKDFRVETPGVAWEHSLVLLISNGTAGPAEVLAAALAENKRAQTVGERTFGTASEQRVITLEDGAAIILTVANFFSPAGKNIAAEGVTPQVAVDDRSNESDEQVRVPLLEDPVVKKGLEALARTPQTQVLPKAASNPRRNPALLADAA